MLEVRDYGYNYKITFRGSKEEYLKFFVAINNIPNSTKLKEEGYKMPKCYLSDLEKEFTTKLIANPWDYIGEGLKLEPYSYQKESIKFAVDNKKGLLILPCGSGKTVILVGIYHEFKKNNLIKNPAMIVVKASLKYQWVKEVEKFSNYRVKAIDTPSKVKKKFEEQFEDADIFVLNYETLKNKDVVKKLREKKVEVMLCD